MGLNLIQKTLLSVDGITPSTELSEYVLRHFQSDIDCIVSWSKSAKPRDYAQFAPMVFELADKGDALAIELLRQTAKEIEQYLIALNKKGATKIALMGSIAERIEKWLSPPIQKWLVKPRFDAIEGAIMFAGKAEHNLFNPKSNGVSHDHSH